MTRHQNSLLCSSCPLATLGLEHGCLTPLASAISKIRLAKGQVRTCEDLSEHFAIVEAGALKVEFLSMDGRPETAGFLFPGEPLVCAVSHEDVAVTALQDSCICNVRLGRVDKDALRLTDCHERFAQTFADQAGADQRRLIKARSGAIEDRLMWFIKDLSDRQGTNRVEIPMTRSDIAHYLNTSAESVSRTFTNLRRKGFIERLSTRVFWLSPST